MESTRERLIQHFVVEESYMEKYHCPAAKSNVEEHKILLEKADQLNQLVHQSNPDISLLFGLAQRFSETIINHVKNTDSQLQAYVKKQK